jgi:hypothetical protein
MALPTPSADVTITLAVAPKKQVWAASVHYPATKSTTRCCGTLETGANAHSGLATALVAIMPSNKKLGRNMAVDATIRIVTQDAQFGHACDLLAAGLKVTGLRSSRQLYHPLIKSLKRFKITTGVVAEGNTHVQSLKNWAVNSLTPVVENKISLRVFTPKRVQESISV